MACYTTANSMFPFTVTNIDGRKTFSSPGAWHAFLDQKDPRVKELFKTQLSETQLRHLYPNAIQIPNINGVRTYENNRNFHSKLAHKPRALHPLYTHVYEIARARQRELRVAALEEKLRTRSATVTPVTSGKQTPSKPQSK